MDVHRRDDASDAYRRHQFPAEALFVHPRQRAEPQGFVSEVRAFSTSLVTEDLPNALLTRKRSHDPRAARSRVMRSGSLLRVAQQVGTPGRQGALAPVHGRLGRGGFLTVALGRVAHRPTGVGRNGLSLRRRRFLGGAVPRAASRDLESDDLLRGEQRGPQLGGGQWFSALLGFSGRRAGRVPVFGRGGRLGAVPACRESVQPLSAVPPPAPVASSALAHRQVPTLEILLFTCVRANDTHGPADPMRAYSTRRCGKRHSVRLCSTAPGRSTVLGWPGRLGESGRCWVSRQREPWRWWRRPVPSVKRAVELVGGVDLEARFGGPQFKGATVVGAVRRAARRRVPGLAAGAGSSSGRSRRPGQLGVRVVDAFADAVGVVRSKGCRSPGRAGLRGWSRCRRGGRRRRRPGGCGRGCRGRRG